MTKGRGDPNFFRISIVISITCPVVGDTDWDPPMSTFRIVNVFSIYDEKSAVRNAIPFIQFVYLTGRVCLHCICLTSI